MLLLEDCVVWIFFGRYTTLGDISGIPWATNKTLMDYFHTVYGVGLKCESNPVLNGTVIRCPQ